MNDAAVRRLYHFLTCAALLVFAWLAVRHVGESAFLEDQVDQLQNFEALLALQPEGLWGAVMSGTVPPARALGPLGAVVFGAPVALGLGIDSIHLLTSLLIVLGTAVVFIALSRIDTVFAWVWLLFFAASGVVWWNVAMFWTNTLLLPLGLTLMALAVSCLRQPRLATLAWLVVTGLFSLQLHLVAIVAAAVVAIIAAVTVREARAHRPGRVHAAVLVVATILALAPYAIAEATTGFQNTRAIFTQLESAGRGTHSYGLETATTTLAIAGDPMRLSERAGAAASVAIVFGCVVALGAMFLVHRFRESGTVEARVMWWLTVCAVTGIAGQALFFLWMARPFAGFHHVTILAPVYAVPPAVLVRCLLPRATSVSLRFALGVTAVAFLLLAGPSLADRFAERTPWSYKRIVAALDALCGDAAVDTAEGQAFAARLNTRNDSVLRYLMKRRFVTCRYQPGSDILIAVGRNEQNAASRVIDGATYRLELELPPGVARYRREP
jgi:hypothetical protein